MPRAGIRALPAQEARTKKRQANFTTCSLDITLPRNPTSRLAADSPHVPRTPPPHHPPSPNTSSTARTLNSPGSKSSPIHSFMCSWSRAFGSFRTSSIS